MLPERTFVRLDALRFPLIVGVVFIHAYEGSVEMAGQIVGVTGANPTADFVRNAISQGVARLSVPILFLFSGYLFLREGELTPDRYLRKMRARMQTLVVPWVLWNVFTLALMALAQSLPSTAPFFSGRNIPVADYSLSDTVAAIFGIGRAPAAHQFWFVRDLFVLLLLSPVLAGLLRTIPGPTLLLLLTCWYLDAWPVNAPSAEATFFVALGFHLALTGRDIFSLDRFGPAAAVVYVLLLTADALLFGWSGRPYIHNLGMLFGIVALLFYSARLVDRAPRLARALVSMGGASFFVFAAHDPLLTAVRKLSFRMVAPESASTITLLYFAVPSAVIVSLVVLHRTLSTLLPRATGIISGGRAR